MSHNYGENNNRVYKLVLTGGPCGGKTTGQARLCSFFEKLGWKVFRVPETASVLMGGGIRFAELSEDEVYSFQENLMKTMLQIENTFFELASKCSRDCLVICDRGIMDASAYLKKEQYEKMCSVNGWNTVVLRDERYNQVIHMVSAANGAEPFYTIASHVTRSEGIDHARELDTITAHTWVGHPYFDVIDNSTDFEAKISRMISVVCQRLDLEVKDRLLKGSKKRKYLVKSIPIDSKFPVKYQDFIVVHDYLVTPDLSSQARIRKRGQKVRFNSTTGHWEVKTSGNWTFTHTIRRPTINGESPELKMQITEKEYHLLMAQKDKKHGSVYKKRRCFIFNDQYFQLDIYVAPFSNSMTNGLMFLETYTVASENVTLPSFITIDKEVTKDRNYSMFDLTLQ